MHASETMRSVDIVEGLIACPLEDLDPLRDLMADRSREKLMRHLSQKVVVE